MKNREKLNKFLEDCLDAVLKRYEISEMKRNAGKFVSDSNIAMALKRRGGKVSGRRVVEYKKMEGGVGERAVELYKSGLSVKDVAKVIGCSTGYAGLYLKDMKVTVPWKGENVKERRKKRSERFNNRVA